MERAAGDGRDSPGASTLNSVKLVGQRPLEQVIAGCKWLTEAELTVYSTEYTRNGFQGEIGRAHV